MIDEYRIRGDSGISDHLPVSFRICLKKERRQSCCYKMNSTWLADPAMKAEISKLWKAFPEGTHFLVKFRRAIRYYRAYCRRKATERRSSEVMLRERLSRIQSELQSDPGNVTVQSELELGLKQLENFEELKLKGQRLRARVRWREYGDSCKKEFFRAVKAKHSKTRISKLERSDGSSTSDLTEMKDHYHEFYRTLHSDPGASAGEQ
jgi:hypothetical protein